MNENSQQRNILVISVIIVVAIVAAGALIVLSNNQSSGYTDYSTMTQSRLPDGGYVLGNTDAPVTIIEFADYSCPSCHQYQDTMNRYVEQFVKPGLARYEYRIFPTHGGQLTAFIGQIVDCLEQQKTGSFWIAHDLLFEQSMKYNNYDENTAKLVAEKMGLDYPKALACSQTTDRVDTDVKLGERLGVTGTPAVMVRYGKDDPKFITYGGQTYNQGGVPFEVLAAVVAQSRSG
jgi:protein-disulfide isomerase